VRAREIYVVGSLNIDLVTRMERLPRPGETVLGGDLALFPGGKGANQACAAGRFGGRAKMIGQTGRDAFGEQLRVSLRDAGVDTAGVGYSDRSTGSACIGVLPSGENAIVISPGANATMTPELALARLQDLAAGDLVLLQLEIPLETVQSVLEFARRRSAVTMLDPAPPRELAPQILRAVDFLTPNQSEAAEVLRDSALDLDDPDAIAGAAARLRALGPRAVILKLGEAGCFLSTPEVTGPFAGRSVQAVDTTAAGDTFNGAFAVAISEGMPLDAAATFANAAAAISVTRHGAQSSIPDRVEVERVLAVRVAT
jgi:ribokinase